jgi:hypothetical protein
VAAVLWAGAGPAMNDTAAMVAIASGNTARMRLSIDFPLLVIHVLTY